MLPNKLQHHVFGELKSKLQPKPNNLGKNNFFKKSPICPYLFYRLPMGLSETVVKLGTQVKYKNYKSFGEIYLDVG